MELQSIFNNTAVNLLDVRETFEYDEAHIDGSVNIPLALVPLKLDIIKQMEGPIIAYCRSGNRSGQAIRYLGQQGLTDIYNGGSLEDIEQYIRTT